MRSVARETVFQYLFSRLFNQQDEGLFDVLIKNLNDDDKAFAEKLKNSVEENLKKYDGEIENLVNNYKVSRIFSADKCAILLGMAEIDNFPDTPKIVVIDEAVKLAAKFSTENSTDFVNGVLAEYAKDR